MDAGATEKTVAGYAFWGYDEYYFVESGSSSYDFYETKTAYIDFLRHIEPYSNNVYDCGSSSYQWRTVYTHTLRASENIYLKDAEIGSSDKNKKKDILPISDKYDELFDKLRPVSYKFRENTSGRTHMGFVAQDVRESLDELQISTTEFAPYCEWEEPDKTITCGLRYSEFIALNTYELQKLKSRVEKLEKVLR